MACPVDLPLGEGDTHEDRLMNGLLDQLAKAGLDFDKFVPDDRLDVGDARNYVRSVLIFTIREFDICE